MSRGRKRKSDKGSFTEAQMANAVRQVIIEGISLREAAERNGVKFQTLARYVTKKKNHPEDEIRMTPKYKSRQIFSDVEEQSLCEYVLECTKMCYGKTTKNVRELAYELAVANSKNIPESWKTNKRAGIDWFSSFMKRHPTLSIRQPEGCSLSRATSFNQHNVAKFFDNLYTVMERSEKLRDPSRIFNIDETATTTVHKPKKIIAKKGMKQVSKATSGERGTLVTTCCIINAAGNSLPPIMIFPRKKFKEHMLIGAPPGTLGLANPTGWMNTELFEDTFRHFIKNSASSLENPSVLVMDNHESHFSVKTLTLAKENGVTIVTLPPHCSNKLQPLDVTVFFSFKSFYNAAVDSWLLGHPGVPMNIYGIAGCVGQAFQKSMTPANIIAGFRKTGIYPYDRHIFTEEDFLTSEVTNRALIPHLENEAVAGPNHAEEPRAQSRLASDTSRDEDNATPIPTKRPSKKNAFITPEALIGFPKAKELKMLRKSRAKGKSAIMTDTPERSAIAMKEREKLRKDSLKKSRLRARKDRLKELESSESEIEENSQIELDDSEDVSDEEREIDFEPPSNNPKIGEYILVEFSAKKKIYYVAKVIENKNEIQVSYLRKSLKYENCFIFPLIRDEAPVLLSDIKTILPSPQPVGTTKRQNNVIKFPIKFDSLEIR